MGGIRFKFLALIVIILSLFASEVFANQKISQIKITGNNRIENSTIDSYLELHANGIYSQEAHDQSIKNLYNTGLFAKVDLTYGNNIVTIFVEENPIINKIAFEGNKRIKDEEILPELLLKPRIVFSRAKLQNDINKIVTLYAREGRFAAVIEPKIIKLDENRINLIFEVDEGPKTVIKKINFVGNKVFGDYKLHSILASKESAWWRFFSSADNYDGDKLDYDKEQLRQFYFTMGYADFKIISVTSDLLPSKDGFFITFAVEEGPRYNFGEININSEIAKLDVSELKKKLLLAKGNIFNADKVEKTVVAITEKLNDEGYAFVDVDPIYKRNLQEHVIDVDFDIKSTNKVYINRIDIHGNLRTIDNVIRREFRLNEGDPFNASKLKRSEQRIKDLDYFDKVKVITKRTDKSDKIDIDVDVTEKSTGDINFGAGYSTTDGPLGRIGIKERNILGTGHELSFMFEKAQKQTNFNLGYTNPRFLDRDLTAGIDLFNLNRDLKTQSSFTTDSVGGKLRFGYDLTEYLHHNINYGFTDTNVKVTSLATRSVKEQAGWTTTSAISHALIYDTRNSKIFPTSGFYFRFGQEFAGLGGDSRFISNEFKTSYFWPVLEEHDVVLKLSASGGHIFGNSTSSDKGIKIFQRYFLGGDNLRGFRDSGIGPRDPTNNHDALGGNSFYAANMELSFPLGFPKEFDVSGAAFMDAGNLFGIDDKSPNIVGKNGSVRVSAGAGIVWITRIGPVRIDWAKPLVKESFDRTKLFRITFSTGF